MLDITFSGRVDTFLGLNTFFFLDEMQIYLDNKTRIILSIDRLESEFMLNICDYMKRSCVHQEIVRSCINSKWNDFSWMMCDALNLALELFIKSNAKKFGSV